MKGDLQHRANWGTLAFAFIVWAGHFMSVYGAVLILPGQTRAVRLVVVIATLVAGAMLAARWFALGGEKRSALAILSIAIAALAIAYQTAPGLIG